MPLSDPSSSDTTVWRWPLAGAGAVCLLLLGGGPPAMASPLDECWSVSANRIELGTCLEGLATEAEAALARVVAEATGVQAELDAITGGDRASRTLDQAQRAYALYRDLDCQLAELQAGAGTGAGDQHRACRIEHDRARAARLAALLPVDATPMLQATAWRAATIASEPVAEGVEITLAINAENRVSGRGGCNRYFGTAGIDGDSISLDGLGSTRMACPEPAMGEEQRYFAALERAASWRISGDTLYLDDTDGVPVASFTRDEADG